MEISLELQQKIDAFHASKSLRRTVQRDAILRAAFGSHEHFTAEELLVRARKIEPSVSRATVYRTLPLLVESGLLSEVELGGERTVYDPNFVDHPHHNHLICMDCSRIVEFEDSEIDALEDTITEKLGFSPAKKAIRIEGTCQELRRFGSCSNRKTEDCSRH